MDDKEFLKLAVEQTKKSVAQGGFPAGAVVVKNGEIIATGISIGHELHDPTSHAETAAIRTACQILQTSDLRGATLYESLECCTMCFSVSYWAGITKIVYGCKKTPKMIQKHYYEGTTQNSLLNQNNNSKIEIVYRNEFENEILNIVRDWERAQQ